MWCALWYLWLGGVCSALCGIYGWVVCVVRSVVSMVGWCVVLSVESMAGWCVMRYVVSMVGWCLVLSVVSRHLKYPLGFITRVGIIPGPGFLSPISQGTTLIASS